MSRLRFGQHVVDTQARTLTRGGKPVPLQRQPFELLQLLVERAGDIVTRDDIRARVWGDTVVEYDLGINYAVRQIRAALGDDARFVQTVTRQGYRFTAQVEPVDARRPSAYLRAAAVAALAAVFASGFGAGLLASERQVRQFVYDHVVHPERCPYMNLPLLVGISPGRSRAPHRTS